MTSALVIEVVGHTPSSIDLAYDDPDGVTHLFTLDSLFPGGVRRTWSPGDFLRLIDKVETKIFGRFPEHTRLPGHGDDSTRGGEVAIIPRWRDRACELRKAPAVIPGRTCCRGWSRRALPPWRPLDLEGPITRSYGSNAPWGYGNDPSQDVASALR